MLRKVICLIGICICGYLLYLTEYVGICLGHCDPMNYSLGLSWFLVGLLIRGSIKRIWAALGIIGILYFVLRELFEGFCLYCTIIHMIAIGAIVSLKTDQK